MLLSSVITLISYDHYDVRMLLQVCGRVSKSSSGLILHFFSLTMEAKRFSNTSVVEECCTHAYTETCLMHSVRHNAFQLRKYDSPSLNKTT